MISQASIDEIIHLAIKDVIPNFGNTDVNTIFIGPGSNIESIDIVQIISGIEDKIAEEGIEGYDLFEKAFESESLTFKELSVSKNDIFEYQTERLVSSDHLGTTKSVIVDSNFIEVIDSNLVKMIIWYDNEWGYSNRVVDIVKYVLNKKH